MCVGLGEVGVEVGRKETKRDISFQKTTAE